jgi:hypothetical protein
MNSHDLTLIVTALVAAIPPTAAVWLQARRNKRRVADLHDEVRTNHGKRLGEHIEDMEATLGNVVKLQLLHTAQDDARFGQLNDRLDRAGIPRAD